MSYTREELEAMGAEDPNYDPEYEKQMKLIKDKIKAQQEEHEKIIEKIMGEKK